MIEAFAPCNGMTLCYETFGRTSDPPIVLVMGLATQMILWDDDFCEDLAARGRYVVRFDNRDVGRSTHLADGDPAARYTLGDMAADTVGLMDALGLPSAHVAGVSMGGAIAQEIALRFRPRIRTLTSIMSSTGDPFLPPPTLAALGVLFARPAASREAYLDGYVRRWKILTGDTFPFDAERTREQGARGYDRGYNPPGAAHQMRAIVRSGNRKRALRALQIPTLIVHGTHDPLVRFRAALDLRDTIPGATLLAIEGMGHTLPRGAWPRILDAIEALTALEN